MSATTRLAKIADRIQNATIVQNVTVRSRGYMAREIPQDLTFSGDAWAKREIIKFTGYNANGGGIGSPATRRTSGEYYQSIVVAEWESFDSGVRAVDVTGVTRYLRDSLTEAPNTFGDKHVAFKAMGHPCVLHKDGTLKVGCQMHTLAHWKQNIDVIITSNYGEGEVNAELALMLWENAVEALEARLVEMNADEAEPVTETPTAE